MTLPASGPISLSQIATEVGLSLPVSINHAWLLKLINKSGFPISFTDFLGKTGRFDGNVPVNSNGIGPLSLAPFFDSSLNRLNRPSLSEVDVSPLSSPTVYTGNIRLINNTTGISAVLIFGSGQWSNTSAPTNLVRLSTNDNFTILPSN